MLLAISHKLVGSILIRFCRGNSPFLMLDNVIFLLLTLLKKFTHFSYAYIREIDSDVEVECTRNESMLWDILATLGRFDGYSLFATTHFLYTNCQGREFVPMWDLTVHCARG